MQATFVFNKQSYKWNKPITMALCNIPCKHRPSVQRYVDSARELGTLSEQLTGVKFDIN
jgi:hypothetical protein